MLNVFFKYFTFDIGYSSAAINFKNIVSKHWKVREDCFTISDVDKNMIRQNFLECVVKSNDMIRYVLAGSLSYQEFLNAISNVNC